MTDNTQRLVFRLLLLLSLLAGLALSARATSVTIGSAQIPNIQSGAGSYELRIWLDRTMVDSAGVTWGGGAVDSPTNYVRVPCALASTTVTCDPFTLASTEDAQQSPEAKYTAKLYRNGAPLLVYNKPFRLPASLGPSVTWAQVWRHNNGVTPRLPDTEVYTKSQVNALFAGSIFANPATTTSRGVGKSSMNAPDPVFVETTDPRLVGQAATTAAAGIVVLSTDGEATAGEAVQGSDSRLASASVTNRGTVRTTTSSSTATSYDDARLSDVINITGYPYNARCDWNGTTGTDDTAAIQLAIGDALAAHRPLYIPASPGGCLVYAVSNQIFLLNKMSIEIFGDGYEASRLIVKSNTPNTVDVFHFSPPATGGQPTGAWAHQENGRDNRGLYMHDFAILAQVEPSMYTQPYPSQPARHAVYFDTRTAGQFIEGLTVERMWFGSFSGNALYFDNSNGGTWANLDGQYQMTIHNNVIRNGIVGNWWGDSLRITNNRFIGENAAVDSKQVSGATTLNFMDNNCTSRGGCGVFHNGYSVNYLRNIVELGFAGSVGVSGALVDFRGDLDEIKSLQVEGNIFNSIGAGGNLDGVKVDNCVGAYIGPNNYNSALSGPHYRVVTTTSSLNTYISKLNINMSGTAALTNGVDPFPLYEITADTYTGGATLTPGYLGVERTYARSIFAAGNATPLQPTLVPGAHFYYDSDAQVSGGVLSASGGSGAAVLTSADFGAGTRHDFYFAGERGELDFTSGVSVGSGGTPTKKLTHGTCTLSAGACTVSTAAVTASSRIMLSGQDNNVTGALRVSARSAGVSFTITSSAGGDSGVVAYEIVEP